MAAQALLKTAAIPDLPTSIPNNDEPSEPTSEDSVPSDGRDEIGEAMIRDLPFALVPQNVEILKP